MKYLEYLILNRFDTSDIHTLFFILLKRQSIRDLNLIITVPADFLAAVGARTSTGKVMNEGLDMFTYKFLWWLMTPYHIYGSNGVIKK